MDDITKAFLDKCSEVKDVNSDSYGIPSMSKLDVEEIFAVGGESTTVAAVSIGVSAVSA